MTYTAKQETLQPQPACRRQGFHPMNHQPDCSVPPTQLQRHSCQVPLVTCPVVMLMCAGGVTDESGVPMNPVRGGLPMGPDELAAFKMVAAALLMAYVEVWALLHEWHLDIVNAFWLSRYLHAMSTTCMLHLDGNTDLVCAAPAYTLAEAAVAATVTFCFEVWCGSGCSQNNNAHCCACLLSGL